MGKGANPDIPSEFRQLDESTLQDKINKAILLDRRIREKRAIRINIISYVIIGVIFLISFLFSTYTLKDNLALAYSVISVLFVKDFIVNFRANCRSLKGFIIIMTSIALMNVLLFTVGLNYVLYCSIVTPIMIVGLLYVYFKEFNK